MIRGSEGRREGGDSPATARGGRGEEGGREPGEKSRLRHDGPRRREGGRELSRDVIGADGRVQWARGINSELGVMGRGGGRSRSRRPVMTLAEGEGSSARARQTVAFTPCLA